MAGGICKLYDAFEVISICHEKEHTIHKKYRSNNQNGKPSDYFGDFILLMDTHFCYHNF